MYSFIVPVYNRPDEVQELLDSLLRLDDSISFEVIIVEDGSTVPCLDIIDGYKNQLNIRYIMNEANWGGGAVPRNMGAGQAQGDYLIFLDSDVLLSPKYLQEVDSFLSFNELDAFGGPDMAHSSFSNLQKAISHSMTSFLTTGGIRNKKKPISGKYYPRSFNFGIKKEVFLRLNGFPEVYVSEDILLSHRLIKEGYSVGFIPNAVVYHKRKTSLRKFFKQVFLFGESRANLPVTKSVVHYLPALFVIFCVCCVVCSFVFIYAILPLILYAFLVFIDSLVGNRSVIIAMLSVVTAYIQHFGYGLGFIKGLVFKPKKKKYQI
jgi:glycosyltransferase involved in cell wall biosynthesis